MAPNNTSVLSAHSTRPTPQQAIDKFKELIDDEDLILSGQFIWAFRYRQELKSFVLATAGADPAVSRFWNATTTGSSTFLDDFLSATAHPVKRKVIDDSKRKALNDPSMTSSSPAARAIRLTLQGRANNGVATYDRATRLLATGTPIRPSRKISGGPQPGARPADPDFARIFNPAGLTFEGAASISGRAKDRCFDMTNAVCNYIGNRGGLTIKPELPPQGQPVNGKPAKATVRPRRLPANSPGEIFEGAGFTSFPSPLGDLVRYQRRLASAVKTATDALDKGHLLNAAVLSGIRLNNKIGSPDHFLPMIAWEEFSFPMPHIRFAFWDPDPKATTAFEPGFGRIFFLAGPEAQAEAASNRSRLPTPPPGTPFTPAFWKNGRLTTAREDQNLDSNDAGDDPIQQHRYQITAMTALPGTGRLPQRQKGQ